MMALVEQVLAAWREAERVASEHPSGSPQHDAALAAVEHLRQAYAAVIAANQLTDRDGVPVTTLPRVVSVGPDEA